MAEPIEEICWLNTRRKRLVLITDTRLVERALSRINAHGVHSLPVVASSGGGIMGTIDVLDIIHSLIDSIEKNPGQSLQQNMRRDFMVREVGTLVTRKTYVISASCSVYTALSHLLRLQENSFLVVNRHVDGDVAQLTTPDMDVVGIFALSDGLYYLVQNSMLLKDEPIFRKSLTELGLGKNPPQTVSAKDNVAESFKKIDRLSHGGLAVVDDQGCLVGNLSATDLKGVTRNNCPILNSTNEEFLSRDQKRPWWTRPICVDVNDSLYHTLHQFNSFQVHRMYVVDRSGKPIGEVTHRDVLNAVWNSFS